MIRLQTLGSIDLLAGERDLSALLVQPKRLALLVYLATARPAGFHSRDRILALFWPESDLAKARNSLRQSLHQLRRLLGDEVLTARGEREIGLEATRLVCDAAEFDEAVRAGRYEEALSCYRGDFLPGFHVPDADEALRWLDDERLRRRRDASECARQLVTAASLRGTQEEALRWAHRGVELDPTDEAAVQRLLTVHAATGDVASAKATFAELSRRLHAEFGVRPSRETTQLVQQISQRPASTTAEMEALLPRAPIVDDRVLEVAEPLPACAAPCSETPSPESEFASTIDVGARDQLLVSPRRRPVRLLTVGVTLVLLAFAARWATRSSESDGESRLGVSPGIASIAVLPFVNLSGDPNNEYLSDGMTEELLNLLARVPGLRVAARTSAFAYKGLNVPIDSIGRALRVHHVLEGSIRRNGDRWRVTAQLIDATTGYHLWSDNFEASLSNVVSVQDQIGREIVDRLRGDLVGAAAVRDVPADAQAITAAMKGWQAFRLNSPDAYAAAVAHFTEAIRRDPLYGYAHAGLATVRHWQGTLRWAPPDAAYADAFASAKRALALDSTLVDGWLILGRSAEVLDHDWAMAESYYQRAIAVAPGDPRAYSRRAPGLLRLGREAEALESAQHAVTLDPASPGVHSDLANLYAERNEFAEAEASLRRALTLDPGHPLLLGNLALQLAHQRKYVDADSIIRLVRAQVPDDPTMMGQQAFILANLGRAAQARALVDSASARGLSRVNLAATMLVVGDTAATFALLEAAVRAREDGLAVLLDTAMFAGLRQQPRFRQLLAGMPSAVVTP